MSKIDYELKCFNCACEHATLSIQLGNLAANGLVKVGGAAARAHLCHLGNGLAGVVGR